MNLNNRELMVRSQTEGPRRHKMSPESWSAWLPALGREQHWSLETGGALGLMGQPV